MGEKLGFTNFDGTKPNRAPLERRGELKRDGLTLKDIFDDSTLRNESGEVDQELLRAELHALSGIVIERMWEDLKSHPDIFSKENDVRIPADEKFWKKFSDTYIELAQNTQPRLMDYGQALVKKPEEMWTSEDRMLVRYVHLQTQHEKTFGLPSFIDFIVFYTKLARVAEETFARQEGRKPTREEYESMLEDSSLSTMMLQMMSNSREALVPVINFLGGDVKGNSDEDAASPFLEKYFHIQYTEDQKPILQPNEEVLQMLRKALQSVFQRNEIAGSGRPQVLRCPVIYTGKFKEMCEWMEHEFGFHYLDQIYT